MADTILVVDDSADIALISARMLTQRGFAVITAHTGAEALAMVARQRPSLVLLDVMMPGMSGLDVLRALKADPSTATIPIIMVTAKSTDDDLLSGYQQGADYYITKPFTADVLIYGVSLVLGHQVAEPSPRAT
ncbi:MAG: response regulator [Deltaproteobacteria bacterium]|nr:response regulator [Deltaproteobacteria bacterium]